MTPSELITLINNKITSNSNNEITAEVLRPVLTAMVNQINSLVGNKNNLPIGENNVISSLNNINNSGITIHNGIENPNETPPVSFNLGDFYKEEVNGIIIGFWQYNGNQWTEIITRQQQKERNITSIINNYTVIDMDDIIVFLGSSNSLLTLPNPEIYNNRIITILNESIYYLNLNMYVGTGFTVLSVVNKNEVLKIASNGLSWRKINN
jgi:hypothetical protein